ncbi:hypothetical protein CJ030_MR7G000043 [Morella rubra]|uniref:Uncharacterized protein n=1 Tax=Morella rubra TaxID=262757 RepID=A0A6A1V1N6_9ROSI|nr:hypothetical protein CJ030_MR7G000043 [Morella rubra]
MSMMQEESRGTPRADEATPSQSTVEIRSGPVRINSTSSDYTLVHRLWYLLTSLRMLIMTAYRSRRLSQLIPETAADGTVTARPKTSKNKGGKAQLPYREPPAVVDAPNVVATETCPMRRSSTQPPALSRSLATTGIAARIRMRRSERLKGGVGSQVSSSSKPPIVIDLAEPESGAGVRCSWGPPGVGGVQFRVSDHPSGFGQCDKGRLQLQINWG